MSLLFCDSFRGNDLPKKWTANGATPIQFNSTDTPSRTPGQTQYIAYSGASGANCYWTCAAAQEDATFIAGVAVKAGTWSTSTGAFGGLLIFSSDNHATFHIGIGYNDLDSAGNPKSIEVYLGRGTAWTGGTLLGSAANVLQDGQWVYIEAKVTLHDTTGSVEIKVDGITVINLTGIDTKNAGTKTVFDTIYLCGGTGVVQAHMTDFYLCNTAGSKNNDFLNSPNIYWLIPSGNGNSSQGVGSDGNSTDNYLLVDDAMGSSGGADYVDLINANDKDTYAFTDVTAPSTGPPTTYVALAVVSCPYARKLDAGARTLTSVARLSGTESDTAASALLNGADRVALGIWEAKPGGGNWTIADVNNAEFGYKAT